ncbi:hypothetical protein ACFX13_039813 [Malus domestica]
MGFIQEEHPISKLKPERAGLPNYVFSYSFLDLVSAYHVHDAEDPPASEVSRAICLSSVQTFKSTKLMP